MRIASTILVRLKTSIGVEQHQRLDNIKDSLVAFFHITPSLLATIPNVSDEQIARASRTSTIIVPPRSSGATVRIGLSLTFLFHEFHMAVASLGFFDSSLGETYEARKSRAKQIFKEAIAVLKEAGHTSFDRAKLADGLKILGNNAMQKEWYETAIEMYSCAVALLKDNAVFFCNRAAAFTKIGRYEAAIRDCYEAIKLKEGYVMAYYRIGCAYYEQGKNIEAIREGFLKVLKLDPQNQDAMVSLQLANSKLKDEVASLSEEIESLRSNAVPPVTENQAAGQESTVLVLQGPEEGENGQWKLTESAKENNDDDGDDNDNNKNDDNNDSNNNNEENVSVAEFIETHNTPPPE
ncbi:hypothetical protein VNO77_22384 [Canavalia gladiata]|uniref:Uncharacterized protein n=1 Tax=Canavalia gladiata TaxID=3824 RepID=A0AAN9QAI4_CANGL